jgi:hypothetical protein
LKNYLKSSFLNGPTPGAMTLYNKIWVQMKHKYYSTHIKQNKCTRQNIFKPHIEKVLNLGVGWFLAPHPRGNNPTLTIFNG